MKRSAVLTYHSLDDTGSVISVSPVLFREQMRILAESGRPVVPLSEILDHPGALAITFDDGFRNFYQHAFPVLMEHRFPATVFAVTGHCGGRNDWSQPAGIGIPLLDLMDWQELGEVARHGITVGAHTVNHPHLSALPLEEAKQEMVDSQAELEQRLAMPVSSFCYPYGDFNPETRQLAERFFAMACSTALRFAGSPGDRGQCPRLDMFYFRNPLWFRRIVAGDGSFYVFARRCLRTVRELL